MGNLTLQGFKGNVWEGIQGRTMDSALVFLMATFSTGQITRLPSLLSDPNERTPTRDFNPQLSFTSHLFFLETTHLFKQKSRLNKLKVI